MPNLMERLATEPTKTEPEGNLMQRMASRKAPVSQEDLVGYTKKAAGLALSTLPTPAGAVLGGILQLNKEQLKYGAMQAMASIEEERQIKKTVDISEKTGLSINKVSIWKRMSDYIERAASEPGLGPMGPADIFTSQDPDILGGPGMRETKAFASGKWVLQMPGALARGFENMAGAAGTLAQQTWETASLGNILAKQIFQIDTPGAGLLAEYLIRKHGPEKALEFFDERKAEYAEKGKKFADFWEEQAGKGWEAPDPELMEARWSRAMEYGASVTAESAPTFAAAITAGYITGNPTIGLTIMGMFEKMNSYRSQRKKGVGVRTSDVISSLSGAWEMVTEKIPFDFLMKGNKSRLVKALLGGPIEGTQELLAGMGQNFLEYFGYNVDDWKSIPPAAKEGWKHTFDNWSESVVAGWAMGSGAGMAIPSGGATSKAIEKTANSLDISVEGLSPEDAIAKIDKAAKSIMATEKEVRDAVMSPQKPAEVQTAEDAVNEANKALEEARKPIPVISEGMAQADIESVDAAVQQRDANIEKAASKLNEALTNQGKIIDDILVSARNKLAALGLAEETIQKNNNLIDGLREIIARLQEPIVSRREGQQQANLDVVEMEVARRQELIDEAYAQLEDAQARVAEAEEYLRANQKPTEPIKEVKDGLKRSMEILNQLRLVNVLPKEKKEKPEAIKKEAGFIEVEKTVDALKAPGRWFLSIFEPAKIAAQKHGKESVAAAVRAIGKPERQLLGYGVKELENLDMTYNQIEEWLAKYPTEIQEAIMISRGHGLEDNARALQKQAFAKLPKELKDSKVRKAIDEIADFNHQYLTEVFGEEIETLFGTDVVNVPGYVRDYFYGVYKNPTKINNFLSFWKTTDKYTKQKTFPTYADAKAFGLEIKDPNPVTNLKAEYRAISYKASMMWLKDELMKHGEGKYIMPRDKAPYTWEHIGGREYADPTFSDVLVEPDMAKLINNLISTNKISQYKPLKMLRDTNNFLRTMKFVGSAFHMVSIAKQSIADSGYLGFYKPTARRGFTTGFKKNDPIFQTPEYGWYIENGGGHQYAIESEAQKVFKDTLSKLTESEQKIVKGASLPLKLPVGFVNWMFNSYIPKVKYAKYLDWVASQEKKLGRPLTAGETQEIIKEQQNFYGMMNERLFGRSGTVTGALRFVFIAPGYAEGNYRTMIKAASQWGQGDGPSATRSRSNILNSWIISATAATVGTLILTGKPPKKPETIEEMRDLLKINTGKKDEYGKDIMIDLATYDRDYWDVFFNTLRGRPDIAANNAITRIGGMKAPTAKMISDLYDMMQGKTLYDWKDDKVYHITDPFLLKINKLITHEIKELIPISVSVYKTSRERGIDKATAAIETLLGLRPGRTERDKKEFEIVRDIWDMRDKRETLSYKINGYDDPYAAVNLFNKTLDNIADNKFITDDLKERIDELKIDPEKVINWKRFPVERLSVEQIKEAIKERTYKRYYKDDKGNKHHRGDPHTGWEKRIKELEDELKRRK